MSLAVVGWALVHFTWQAAVVSLGLALCLRIAGPDPRFRYAAACAGLLLLLLVPPLDVVLLAGGSRGTVAAWAAAPRGGDALSPSIAAVAPAVRAIALIWLLGVSLLTVHALGGWRTAAGLRRAGARPARGRWQAALAAATRRVGSGTAVTLLETTRVDGPTVVGVRRPVILLPAAGLDALPTGEIEALLAHELAHVRRGDLAAALVQVLAETVLFFHPLVWWVSRTIRHEREASCDAVAAQAVGDPRRYARALARLEVLRASGSSMAMAAGAGSLLRRLERLTSKPRPSGRGRAWSAATAGMCVAAVLSVAGAARVFPETVAMMRAQKFVPTWYVVHARDDAGAFTVAVAGGRVVRAVVAGVAVHPAAIRQRGDSVTLPWDGGEFTLLLRPGGGFTWASRTP